jgi:hypothetical protein
MRLIPVGILLVAAVLAFTPVSMAHHSFAAQYDRTKPVTLIGTITKLEWMNPHIYFYIDVKDVDGRLENWAIEGGAPNSLLRRGWRKNMLPVGVQVTVDGWLAKDGSKLANMREITFADGKTLLAGSSGGDK